MKKFILLILYGLVYADSSNLGLGEYVQKVEDFKNELIKWQDETTALQDKISELKSKDSDLYNKVLQSLDSKSISYVNGTNKFFENLNSASKSFESIILAATSCDNKKCIERKNKEFKALSEELLNGFKEFNDSVHKFVSALYKRNPDTYTKAILKTMLKLLLVGPALASGFIAATAYLVNYLFKSDILNNIRRVGLLFFTTLTQYIFTGSIYGESSLKDEFYKVDSFINNKALKDYFAAYVFEGLQDYNTNNEINFLTKTYKALLTIKSNLSYAEWIKGTDKYDQYIIDVIFNQNPLGKKLLPLRLSKDVVITP